MSEQIILFFVEMIRVGTPLLLATLGEIYAERAGVMNLGIEGIMVVSALIAFVGLFHTGDPMMGLIMALGVSLLLSLIFAILVVTLRANQLLSGLALSMFGLGLSGFLGKPYLGQTAPAGFTIIPIPILSEIPVIGPILFNQYPLVYLSYILVPVMWYVLFKSWFGLYVRSVGEDPATADVMGINVYLMRYLCIIIGGLLAGLSGAYLTLSYTRMWIEGMSAGRGWIAIALTIFSLWNPLRAVLGSYLFGAIMALQFRLQALEVGISSELLLATPYLFTIVILVITSQEVIKKKLGAPAALYKPYVREELIT